MITREVTVSAVHRSQGSSVALLERLVLATFANPLGQTRPELEERTGLSRTVVAGVVASLVARGELVETQQAQASGGRGRPPARYQRTALLPPVLMIRLGKDSSTSVSLVCGDGGRSEEHACGAWSQSWQDWSRSVGDAAAKLRVHAQVPPRLAVLSVPFPVAEGQGAPRMYQVPAKDLEVMGKRMPPSSPWLEGDPRPALGDLLGCPALMVNDANLAALGEARFGAGRGRRAVFHVCVVEGIGAGFVFGGRLFSGAHGFSGELAHVQVVPDGIACVCGNHGCLITQMRTCDRAPGPISDYLATQGPLVGQALAPLVTALDPDCVIVDARLGERAGPFIQGVTAELRRRCPHGVAGSLAVVAGELENAERFGALAAADIYAATLVSESMWPVASAAL
jgi:hypothetical protein